MSKVQWNERQPSSWNRNACYLFPFGLIRSVPPQAQEGKTYSYMDELLLSGSLPCRLLQRHQLYAGVWHTHEWLTVPDLGGVSREQKCTRCAQPSLFLCMAWALWPYLSSVPH